MSPGDLNTQLLLNLGQQVAELQKGMGNVEAKLEAGADKHKYFEQKLDIIDHRTDVTETKVVKLDEALNPTEGPSLFRRVKTLEDFNGKIGAIISLGATALWLLGWFIWNTLTWVWSHFTEIKNGFRSLFH